jgi:hypothetical protein
VAEDTFATRSEGVLEDLVAGVSVADAARQHQVASRTIERWLSKGRLDPECRYGPFAEAVDRARAARALPPPDERPADPAELRLLVSIAARIGNVQAMRLLWEIVRDEAGGEASPGDILDELEAKRRAKA